MEGMAGRLVKCKDCGREISSSAEKCPQCGRKRATTFSEFIVAAIIIGAAYLFFFGGKDDEPRQLVPPENPSIYKTTANQLYLDYEANEVATDNKIGKSMVEIRGELVSIDKDFTNSIILQLAINDSFSHAGMSVLDSESTTAARLVKGQSVTLRCKSVRRILGSPQASDCEILGG